MSVCINCSGTPQINLYFKMLRFLNGLALIRLAT